MAPNKQQKAVIVGGIRTPFVRRGKAFMNLSPLDLGQICISELIHRYDLPYNGINTLIFGQVVPTVEMTNIAREIVLGIGLSPSTDGFSLNRACATSYQTVVSAIQQIEHGGATCIIAGGADSSSVFPVSLPDHLRQTGMKYSQSKSWPDKLKSASKIKSSDFKPKAPNDRELSTGLTMGESAEKMAKENEITRDAQDDFAHQSHVKAAKSWKKESLMMR